MIIKIPSKSLLFGEYGVLYGFTGIVINSWTFYCEFDFQVVKDSNVIGIYSDYFSNNAIFLNKKKIITIANYLKSNPSDQNFLKTIIIDKDELFFTCILIPYSEFLNDFSFNLNINKYFDKSFGFGSSSAIIVCINLFLQRTMNLSETEVWKNIRYTMQLSQGKGSCYDVSVQFRNAVVDADIPITMQKIWRFKNTLPIPCLFQLNFHGDFGTILKTGVYSDTKKTLKNFDMNNPCNFNFAQKNSELAEKFVENPHNINNLIKQSFTLQQSHGLTIKNVDLLFSNLNFKYLGSGKGDTIWTTTSELNKIQNQYVLYKIIL